MKKKYFCFVSNLNDNIIKNIKKFNNLYYNDYYKRTFKING